MTTLDTKPITPRIRAQRRFGRQAEHREARRQRRIAAAAEKTAKRITRIRHANMWTGVEEVVEQLIADFYSNRVELEFCDVLTVVNKRKTILLDLSPIGSIVFADGNKAHLYVWLRDCSLYIEPFEEPARRVRGRDYTTEQLELLLVAVRNSHND